MTVDEKFGQIIRDKRKEKRMTLKELGNRLGVAESTVHHYETGYRGMSINQFFEICEILDLNPNEVQKELSKYLEKNYDK